ncbi:hypothetical protein [Candidatus Magnetaquiglobus chichijimensis]
MKPSHLIFRLDADQRIGIGHLRRCLVLADAARLIGIESTFVLGCGADESRQVVLESGYPCQVLLSEEAYDADVIVGPGGTTDHFAIMMLDMSHFRTFEHLREFELYLHALRHRFCGVAILDAAYCDSLRARLQNPAADCIISPYCGEIPVEPVNGILYCNGTAYYPLDSCYRMAETWERPIRRTGDRVLISCGGADPLAVTLRIQQALERIDDRRLDARIVVGPCFPEPLRLEINRLSLHSRHHVELLPSPRNLAEWMIWSDLAISLSGLTKYELAATGTPTLLLSIDHAHADINRPFEEAGSSLHLGVAVEVDAHTLAQEVVKLLENVSLRLEMSGRGRKLVDGRGAERILHSLTVELPKGGPRYGG